MKNYVDGFLLPVEKSKIEEYRLVAQKAAKIWKEHGALDYWECVGDDLEVKDMLGFAQIANAGEHETVILSWVIFKSREHRDEVNAKIMADPRIKELCEACGTIFDGKRMAYGGFKTLIHA